MSVEDEIRALGIVCNPNQFNEYGVGLAVAKFDNRAAFIAAVKKAASKVLTAEFQDGTPLLFPGVTPGRPRKFWNVLLDTGLMLRFEEIL